MSWIQHIERAQFVLGDRFGRLIAWANLAIIVVLLWEVSARYLFDSPTDWAHEASTMLFGGYCLAAGVYTQTHNGHVRIDVIYQLFGARGRAVMDCISGLLIITALSFLLVVSFKFAQESWLQQEVSSKSPWRPLLYPIKAVIPMTVALLILNQCLYFIRDLLTALGQMAHRLEVDESDSNGANND